MRISHQEMVSIEVLVHVGEKYLCPFSCLGLIFPHLALKIAREVLIKGVKKISLF